MKDLLYTMLGLVWGWGLLLFILAVFYTVPIYLLLWILGVVE